MKLTRRGDTFCGLKGESLSDSGSMDNTFRLFIYVRMTVLMLVCHEVHIGAFLLPNS